MASTTRHKHNGTTHHRSAAPHINAAASDFWDDGRKLANAFYQDGLHQVDMAEENIKEYSGKVLKKVKANPVASLAIAGGVGFLLSLLFRK